MLQYMICYTALYETLIRIMELAKGKEVHAGTASLGSCFPLTSEMRHRCVRDNSIAYRSLPLRGIIHIISFR